MLIQTLRYDPTDKGFANPCRTMKVQYEGFATAAGKMSRDRRSDGFNG